MTDTIDHRTLYRLPWSLPANAIAWLEPTKKCNLACLGCYRENDPRSQKTLAELRHRPDVFKRFRTVDGVPIAGGDPITHPEIAQIVKMVAAAGDIGCSFNATVYGETLHEAPDILSWAQRNIEIVDTVMLIAVRTVWAAVISSTRWRARRSTSAPTAIRTCAMAART